MTKQAELSSGPRRLRRARRLLGAVGALASVVLACVGRPRGGPPPQLGPVTEVPRLGGPERCSPFSAASLAACVDPDRLERDVRLMASPGPSGGNRSEDVALLCAERLAQSGYDVERHAYGTGVNVVGIRRGFTQAAKQVVVSAHYDSLDGCPGADDNASGVAVVLEIARVLAQARFDRTLIAACWDEGEHRQRGSGAYAAAARQRGDDILAAVAFEAVGYVSHEAYSQRLPDRFEERFPDQALDLLENDERGDFLLLVAGSGTTHLAESVKHFGRSRELPVHFLTVRGAFKEQLSEEYRSDHTSFWEAGYPALLMTDTGSYRNPRIHCDSGRDDPDSLSYEFAARVARASIGALVDLLELR